MERNANFIVVGVFTIISLLSLAGFAFWMGKYGIDEDKYDRYKTYVTESVSGLKESSPVKLKGLDVGIVDGIKIDKNNPEQVEITFRVEKEIPVKTDSFIVLNSQGIAGIGYLEIKGGSRETRLLKQTDRREFPVVRSEPSMMSKLTDKAETLLTGLTVTMARVDKLVSEKNIGNVSTGLDNFAQMSTELNANKKEFSNLIAGAKEVEANANHAMMSFSAAATKADSVLDETKAMAQESRAMVHEIKNSGFLEKASMALDETADVMGQTKSLIGDGKLLIQELRESPSDLLFKEKVIQLGPGE